MENFKFILSSVFILALLSFGGYWAFSTIESGSTHVDSQKQKELEIKNEELTKENTELKRQIGLFQSEKDAQIQKDQVMAEVKTSEPTTTTSTLPKVTVSKYQSLINELQKLADGNVVLELKSQGPAVGTLQKFFNIYNNTSAKIDNDFGTGTVTLLKNFQKTQGLIIDGGAGPNTYIKMINWLKNH